MTPIQIRIVAGLARGHTPAQIADASNRTEDGIRSHLRQAAHAAGIRGAGRAAALVDYAYRTGVLAGLTPEERPPVKLTRRMRDILPRLATGASSGEIAAELGVSADSVRSPVQLLYRRLGARNRPHAIALAWQLGFLGAESERQAA